MNQLSSLEALVLNEDNFVRCIFKEEVIDKKSISFLNVQYSSFHRCKFIDIDFQNIYLENCEFSDCQFINSSFSDCLLKKDKFLNCEFVNMKWIKGRILDSSFYQTLFKYFDFHKFLFEQIFFEECDFLESQILDCHLTNCFFKLSCLEKSKFYSCSLKKVDLSTSQLKNTYLDIKKLKECILTPSQGLDLLLFYGIVFKS